MSNLQHLNMARFVEPYFISVLYFSNNPNAIFPIRVAQIIFLKYDYRSFERQPHSGISV